MPSRRDSSPLQGSVYSDRPQNAKTRNPEGIALISGQQELAEELEVCEEEEVGSRLSSKMSPEVSMPVSRANSNDFSETQKAFLRKKKPRASRER